MKKYYTCSIYAYSCKANPQLEETDSDNEANVDPEPVEECAWELDLSALEELEQDNYVKLDPRTECI